MHILLALRAPHVLAILALLVATVALPPQASAAEEAATFTVGPFTFERPMGWETLPSGMIRKAQFRVPNSGEGNPGLVVFFHFGEGVGGSVEANIERWQLQFVEPPETLGARVETGQHAGVTHHTFEAFGTLRATGADGKPIEVPDYGFLGAILEGPESNVFVRFVGPASVVRGAEADFRRMIENPTR